MMNHKENSDDDKKDDKEKSDDKESDKEKSDDDLWKSKHLSLDLLNVKTRAYNLHMYFEVYVYTTYNFSSSVYIFGNYYD